MLMPLGLSRRGPEWIDFTLPQTCSLLVGGMTGTGKSTFIRQLLVYAMLHYTPQQLQLYLIDMKKVEFQLFFDLPHIVSVSTELLEAKHALNDLSNEIDDRYDRIMHARKMDINAFNQLHTESQQLPHILLVIDELSEVAPAREPNKEIKRVKEEFHSHLDRITRMGRAAGVHTIGCTQRPDMYSVPGYIKANLPATVAFRTRGTTDSQILLDNNSAALLAPIPGRGLFQYSYEQIEFQTPFLHEDVAEQFLQLLLRKECTHEESIS
jgi:S-DNA-T family DNA segregation ATPase FtsK/SpoIIIE